ncbi:MAG TPA: oligosaccharide flippase family protein [Candidatus Eremiobacteraceae bacterium]
MELVDPSESPPRSSFDARRFAGDAGLSVGGALIANAFNYVFHAMLSRSLGPDNYGSLAALISVASILGVIGSAINVVAMRETARMWAAHDDGAIAGFVRRTAWYATGIGAITAIALLAGAPLLAGYLHVAQPTVWFAFAVYLLVGITATYARGAAQGAHRFGLFAASLLTEAVVKLASAVALVALGYAVVGAMGGLAIGSAAGLAVVMVVMARRSAMGAPSPAAPGIVTDHLRLGGESLKVLAVAAGTITLVYLDPIFAKHHLDGLTAGYYGAAGTLARIIPFAVGLIGVILMPKSAALHRSSRTSLERVLQLTFGAGVAGSVIGLLCAWLGSDLLVRVMFGVQFSPAAAILPLYAVDTALIAICTLGTNYLVAVGDYAIGWYVFAAVVAEAVLMALFGLSPFRLIGIGIVVNALLLPVIAAHAWRSIQEAPAVA